MIGNKKIAVVTPAYNVERMIEHVVATMPDSVDMMYVVDDASHDQTISRAEAAALSRQAPLTICRHSHNAGVGAAIVTGYQRAMKDQMDIMVVMAGDGQMDPEELATIVQPIIESRADYVKGNRFHYGTSWEVMPRYRFIGNAILSFLTKIASGYWKLSDFQTGYTAVSRHMLERVPLAKLYPRYGFPNDILVKLNVANARVHEVPVKPIYRDEKSGIRLHSVIPKISWLLVRDFFWRLREKYIVRDFHPLVFFYLFGGLALLIGVLFGLYLILFRIISGPVSETSALFAVIFFLFGSQALFFAMWFDMDTNKELQQ